MGAFSDGCLIPPIDHRLVSTSRRQTKSLSGSAFDIQLGLSLPEPPGAINHAILSDAADSRLCLKAPTISTSTDSCCSWRMVMIWSAGKERGRGQRLGSWPSLTVAPGHFLGGRESFCEPNWLHSQERFSKFVEIAICSLVKSFSRLRS